MMLVYMIRGLLARKNFVLPALFAIVATIVVIGTMLSLVEGLTAALQSGVAPDRMIVISEGAASEANSQLSLDALAKLQLVGGIAQDSGAPLVSAERVMTLRFRQVDKPLRLLNVRGVDPVALAVHREITIDGKLPDHTQQGVVLGARAIGRCDGCIEGGSIQIGRSRWPVLGILRAKGSIFESEIWTDRTALQMEFKKTDPSAAYILIRPGAEAEVQAGVKGIPGSQLTAMTEASWHDRIIFRDMSIYLRAVFLISMLITLAAIFACTNVIYAAFLTRTRELATLLAMGFTRLRVTMLIMQESLLLAGLGGLLGLGLTGLLHGRTFEFKELSLVYTAVVSKRVVAVSLAATTVIGLFGSVSTAIQTLRLKVLTALRAI